MHGENRIDAILYSASQDNWDGQGAKAVTQEAADAVRKLLNATWIGPNVDGGLGVDFEHSDIGMVSFDIAADGKLKSAYIQGFDWFIEREEDGRVTFKNG
jgi:hypothetical protein